MNVAIRFGAGVVLLAAVIVVFAWLRRPSSPNGGAGRVFCGVTLSKPSSALLDEVERAYSSPVKEQLNQNLPPGVLAASGIEPLGGPFISIGNSITPDESTIVHELFHLKLHVEKYPYQVLWDSSLLPGDDGRRYERLKRLLYQFVLDPLTHRVFYGRMRAMGLDPATNQRAFVEKLLEEYRQRKADWTPSGRVATYFMFVSELSGDSALIKRIDEWYRAQGWSAELATAKAMIDIAAASDVGTGDQLIETFTRCVNRFLANRASIEFRGWLPVADHPPLTLWTAAFSLVPAPACANVACLDDAALSDESLSSFASW
jgi:hypothetical protein